MSNFVGILLSICKHFVLVILKFSLILISYKLDNSNIFPKSKSVIHRLKLSIMIATLGQLEAR